MYKMIFFILFVSLFSELKAQLVEVVNNYTTGGDVVFGATNFSKTPVFLEVEFTELQNTVDDRRRIYLNRLAPGYNNIFTLTRANGARSPYFYYKFRTYRSDPAANVNLDFPYLVPLKPGTTATVFDVKNIDGFWGDKELKSWAATGFNAQPGEAIYAARRGEIVEIAGETREGNPEFWYNTWTNIITVLQPDGTLISYKNVIDRNHKLKLNQKIFAGQVLGEVASGSEGIIVLIYHNTIKSDDLMFVIPQFVTGPGKIEMLNSIMNIKVVHPKEIRGLEMTKREQRKILNN